MREFRGLNNSNSKRLLNLLESIYLSVQKTTVQRITVVKFVDSDDSPGCFEIKVRTDPVKFTNKNNKFR